MKIEPPNLGCYEVGRLCAFLSAIALATADALKIRVNSWSSCKRGFSVVARADVRGPKAELNMGRSSNSALPLFEKPIDIRSLRIEDACRAHFLEDAAEGLLGGAGAGLGFAHDLFEFGGDEVLPGEDAVFRSRSNALDGGGDAFVPSHLFSLKSKVQSPKSKVSPQGRTNIRL